MSGARNKAVQSVSGETIAVEIGRLSGLPLAELRTAWATEFRRDPPKALWRDLLFRAGIALAHAHTGDLAGAEALIASSPTVCDDCGIARGRIEEMEGQHGRADDWFARAEKAGPSIPFADAAWGEALLARGRPDAAIEKFKLANDKGPHFADPLKGWGEALMAKNRSHLALAKFAEADKYAPNWGRLHLKWGEALGYADKKNDAKVQFARAAGLDFTPTEKAELARQSPHA